MTEQKLEELMLNVAYPMMLHTSSNATAADLFIQGLTADLALSAGGDATLANDAAHLYFDAFRAGSVEAGINLIRIFMITKLILLDDGNEDYPLKDKYLEVYSYLKSIVHPVIPYYSALFDIVSGSNPDDGWAEMEKLAQESNTYAITYLALGDFLPVIRGTAEEDDPSFD